jgi:hypothetical protein
MGRSDLVGRDIVPQLWVVRRISGIPRQVLARELALDECRILSEKKDTALEPNLVRPFFDFAFQ